MSRGTGLAALSSEAAILMTRELGELRQGTHLHYRVDDGPVIATTATKLSFHELTPGLHKIVVMLANNDHSPSGLEQTLEITVP